MAREGQCAPLQGSVINLQRHSVQNGRLFIQTAKLVLDIVK